jgi:carbonic anhydrase
MARVLIAERASMAWSRRSMIAAGAAGLLAARGASARAPEHAAAPTLTPDAALAKLMAGNARYVAQRSTHPHLDAARRRELRSGQSPFAVIVACSDSRVGPELIFDQGLGDLFVIRVAGNVVDDAGLGSIEYAVIHLGAPLIMVLGHQNCGAVKATLDALEGHGSEEDRDTKISALAELITPAVKAVPEGSPDRLNAAVLENARRSAASIVKDSPAVRERLRAGRLSVVSARYSLDDGKVSEVLAASET